MTYDTESDYLFGLHVSRTPKCWAVMSGNTVVEEAADYGDAVAKRVAIIEGRGTSLAVLYPDQNAPGSLDLGDEFESPNQPWRPRTYTAPTDEERERSRNLRIKFVRERFGLTDEQIAEIEAPLSLNDIAAIISSDIVASVPLVRGADFGDVRSAAE
jgi:hypothetical protein